MSEYYIPEEIGEAIIEDLQPLRDTLLEELELSDTKTSNCDPEEIIIRLLICKSFDDMVELITEFKYS